MAQYVRRLRPISILQCISFATCFIEGRGSCPEANIAKSTSVPASTLERVCSAVSTEEAITDICKPDEMEVEIAAFHHGQPIWFVVPGRVLNHG